MQLVKLFLRASASAAAPISLAAASVSDFFVVSSPMSPSVSGDARRSAAQRNHVERVLCGLDGRRQLIAVHAAGLDAAFPLDRGLHQGVGLAARWNPYFVVEQPGQREPELLFDALERLHECVVTAVAAAGRLELLVAIGD